MREIIDGKLRFEIPDRFPKVSSFLRPIEYLAKHVAKNAERPEVLRDDSPSNGDL